MPGVVTGHDGCVENLFEGVAPCFAGFDLDEVQRFFLAFEQQVVKPQKNRGALAKGSRGPCGLRSPCAVHRQLYVNFPAQRDAAEHGTCVRSPDR